jgi:hypothetical protein
MHSFLAWPCYFYYQDVLSDWLLIWLGLHGCNTSAVALVGIIVLSILPAALMARCSPDWSEPAARAERRFGMLSDL